MKIIYLFFFFMYALHPPPLFPHLPQKFTLKVQMHMLYGNLRYDCSLLHSECLNCLFKNSLKTVYEVDGKCCLRKNIAEKNRKKNLDCMNLINRSSIKCWISNALDSNKVLVSLESVMALLYTSDTVALQCMHFCVCVCVFV